MRVLFLNTSETKGGAAIAAKRGYVSEVIEPSETRRRVSVSLELLLNKIAMDRPLKKHGNIPL